MFILFKPDVGMLFMSTSPTGIESDGIAPNLQTILGKLARSAKSSSSGQKSIRKQNNVGKGKRTCKIDRNKGKVRPKQKQQQKEAQTTEEKQNHTSKTNSKRLEKIVTK